jgi:hypothetical protein
MVATARSSRQKRHKSYRKHTLRENQPEDRGDGTPTYEEWMSGSMTAYGKVQGSLMLHQTRTSPKSACQSPTTITVGMNSNKVTSMLIKSDLKFRQAANLYHSALVLPTGCNPEDAPNIHDRDLWVCRILEIKARAESGTDVSLCHSLSRLTTKNFRSGFELRGIAAQIM